MSNAFADNTKLANNILSSIKSVEKIKDSAKTLELAFTAKDIYKTFDVIDDTSKSVRAIDQTLSLTDQVNDIFKYNKNIDDIVDSYKKIDNIAPNKGIDSPKNLFKIQNDDIINKRRTWRQSEQKAEKLFSDYFRQKSFIDGNSTNYGKKGSSRPDLINEQSKHLIDVKRYNLQNRNNVNNLIKNISNQYTQRIKNLPGYSQTTLIDIWGQDVPEDVQKYIIETLKELTNDGIEIWFKELK